MSNPEASPASSLPDEKRQPRQSRLVKAALGCQRLGRFDVTLRNVSLTGIGGQGPHILQIGERMTVFLPGHEPMMGTVRWVAGTRFGIQTDREIETIRRLVTQVYPAGIVSVVSDTWDFWQVVTDFAAALKPEILARQPDPFGNAKVVFRPDSGDPVKILTGYFCTDVPSVEDAAALAAARRDGFEAVRDIETGRYWRLDDDARASQALREAEVNGAVQCLWNIFGGVVTERGYKLLDPHVGLIYGDSITLARGRDILARLERKGFASGNVVLGIGSYTYQYLTRDSFGWALKATYAEVNGEPQELVKDPVTDSGVKRSAKGLLRVDETATGYVLHDQQTPEQAAGGALVPVFRDGVLLVEQDLAQIRERLQGSWVCPEPGSIDWGGR